MNPKYAPTKVSGTEIPNHMARIATSVPKGIAADDPFTQRMRFIMKKSAKTILERKFEIQHQKLSRTLLRQVKINEEELKTFMQFMKLEQWCSTYSPQSSIIELYKGRAGKDLLRSSSPAPCLRQVIHD